MFTLEKRRLVGVIVSWDGSLTLCLVNVSFSELAMGIDFGFVLGLLLKYVFGSLLQTGDN